MKNGTNVVYSTPSSASDYTSTDAPTQNMPASNAPVTNAPTLNVPETKATTTHSPIEKIIFFGMQGDANSIPGSQVSTGPKQN